MESSNLRITFIVGGLTIGGAEKQFFYMLQALRELGAAIQVIILTRGEFYEDRLVRQGFQPVYAGRNPAARLAAILKETHWFQPHFLQATHFFASFYAGLAGRLLGIPSIGAIRSDLYLDLDGIGRPYVTPGEHRLSMSEPGYWLLRLPEVYLANSRNARENAPGLGLDPERIHILHNVIDLETFDSRMAAISPDLLAPGRIYAITVARLVPVKRLERFLKALAIASQQVPSLTGVIVGDGPSAPGLRDLAESLGLWPGGPAGGVRFLGERDDIPQLLAQSAMFVLTSDREGFPNVLLEAMAASLPIVSTPAGETPELVTEGLNGYLVPFDDPQNLAGRLVALAQSQALRRQMGSAGRQMVESRFSYAQLKSNLLETYRAIASQTQDRSILSILESCSKPCPPGDVSSGLRRRSRGAGAP